MSKEYLEALKTIKIKCHPNSNPSPLVDSALDTIEEALQRLESIDNANPSEALECLEEIIHEFNEPHYELSGEYSYKNELLRRCENEVNTIKQALQQKIAWKHIHNTKVRVPLIQIFNGKTQEEKHQIIEDIYYTWEEKKEALEDKNNELEHENAELKAKTQEQEKVLNIIKNKRINVGVFIDWIRRVKHKAKLELWNNIIDDKDKLTQEEFDTLKEVLKCQD